MLRTSLAALPLVAACAGDGCPGAVSDIDSGNAPTHQTSTAPAPILNPAHFEFGTQIQGVATALGEEGDVYAVEISRDPETSEMTVPSGTVLRSEGTDVFFVTGADLDLDCQASAQCSTEIDAVPCENLSTGAIPNYPRTGDPLFPVGRFHNDIDPDNLMHSGDRAHYCAMVRRTMLISGVRPIPVLRGGL